MDKKEQTRLRVKRYRERVRLGVTKEGVTSPSVTGTYFKDGIEMVGPLGTLPARPRSLTLSDGQILDRANPSRPDLTLWPGWRINALKRCNGKMKPLKGKAFIPELRKKYAIK